MKRSAIWHRRRKLAAAASAAAAAYHQRMKNSICGARSRHRHGGMAWRVTRQRRQTLAQREIALAWHGGAAAAWRWHGNA